MKNRDEAKKKKEEDGRNGDCKEKKNIQKIKTIMLLES